MRKLEPGLLRALDEIYASLRRDHPDLPRALVTVEEPHPAVRRRIACWREGRVVTSAGVFEGRIAFGYPSAHRDVPRVLFTGSAAVVLEVLVHEAAHALATARGIKDTSRGGTYHNQQYRQLAEELGLIVAKAQQGGWTETTAGPVLLSKFRRAIASLDNVRPVQAAANPDSAGPVIDPGLREMIAPFDRGHEVMPPCDHTSCWDALAGKCLGSR